MSVLSGIRKAIAAVREFSKEPDALALYQVRAKDGVELVYDGKGQRKTVDFGKAEHVFSAVVWLDCGWSGWSFHDWRIEQVSFYRTRNGAWIKTAADSGRGQIVSAPDVWDIVTKLRKAAENTKALTGVRRGRTIIKHDSLGDAAEILKGMEEA